MKTKMIKAVSLVAALACVLCFPVKASATSQQGTDGTELEVVQAQQLEIQLGQAWTGVEFQLRTDAGKYPDPIPVGEDGVLRVEIGGSENYLLTCLASQVEVPTPEDIENPEETVAEETDTAATEDVASDSSVSTENTSSATEEADPTDPSVTIEPEADAEIATIGGVPVTHVVIFVGGLVIAIALLVFMQMHHKNRESSDADDDENDEF
ncbi:MAG: hypothetical protein IJN67_09370 [Oscillospiraceae bacterium]|nr:hypothetical protein [Oscillospiraceae bacterium]